MSWLARCVEIRPELAQHERALRALGDEAHAHVSAQLAQLARTHESHAILALARAPEMWAAGVFERWLELGERLLRDAPISRMGASRYFEQPLAAFGAGGLDTAEAWCALGRELTSHAPHLGRMFFERTPALLTQPDAIARLRAWIDAAQPHLAQEDWRAGLVLEAYFDGAYALSEPAPWLYVARALAEIVEPRRLFARAPALLAALPATEQRAFLEAVARWGSESAEAAALLLEQLPPLLAAAPREVLGALSALPAQAAKGLAALVPTLPFILQLPAAALRAYAPQIASLASEHPTAALAALRALPELYRRVEPEQTARWFAFGTQLARDNPSAAQAFFALESRTSLRVLSAGSGVAELDESLGMWRKLIHMLSDRDVVVRRLEQPCLRPPLEAANPEQAVSLPEYVDLFGTQAENARVYRFLALQLAGRLEHGTYEGRNLQAELSGLREPLFLLVEGVRIAAWNARAYPGSVRETVELAHALLQSWRDERAPALSLACDVLLMLSITELAADGGVAPPACLPPLWASVARSLLRTLHRPGASVDDALAVADRLASLFDAGTSQLTAAGLPELEAALARAAQEDVGGAEAHGRADPQRSEGEPSAEAEPGPQAKEASSDAQGAAAALDASLDLPLSAAGPEDVAPASLRPRPSVQLAQSYVYDEWDHTLSDYRSRHCHVQELALGSDEGAFFARTVRDNRELLAHVRRQFEHMRPERYRVLRGLEDGEDFDLNALTDARVEARAGRTPNTRIYSLRTRQVRDVATLFLLDMSASTEQSLDEPAPRRIIDTLKEALVVMCTALDTLGDAYAIYGFSSQGRKRVEVYEVKAFDQPLGAAAKARLGSIGPRHGTRMGAALRHTLTKLASVQAHSKHLMLLSDGFPQDQEYGEDRRTHTYGIQDTAVALRELTRAGTLPFCITVDRAGHDYLRLMCDPDQYMVIDHIEQLPRELPKIYRRIVR